MFRYLLIWGKKLLVIFKDFRNVKGKCEKTCRLMQGVGLLCFCLYQNSQQRIVVEGVTSDAE